VGEVEDAISITRESSIRSMLLQHLWIPEHISALAPWQLVFADTAITTDNDCTSCMYSTVTVQYRTYSIII